MVCEWPMQRRQAEAWAKAQGTLKLELLGVQNQVGQALLPVIQELGAEILKLAQDGSFKRWGEEVGAIAKAMATEIELAAKAIDLVASAIDTSIKSDVELYNEITGFSTKSSVIPKPWTPSPNGGFVPPDMRGAITGENAPGAAAGDANAAPDGTKTFNVPDPKTNAAQRQHRDADRESSAGDSAERGSWRLRWVKAAMRPRSCRISSRR